jgi:hypothetical protein
MLLTSKPLTILRPLQGATLPPLPCATEQVHRCPTSFQCQASGTGLRHQAEEDGLSAGTEDPHASKKQQLLLAYEGDHQAKAADALADLFADQPKGA